MKAPEIVLVATLLSSGVLACAQQTSPTRAPPTTTAAARRIGGPLGGAEAATPVGPLPRAPRCRVTFTDTEGCGPGDVETLIEPIRPQIERCRASRGGKLLIRAHKVSGGKLAFDVQPGSSLDPTERKCVLDALATLDVDESATAWGGLNVRPTGFTSLITIEW